MLKSKDNKGQVTITSIDWSSEDLKAFVPYRLPKAQSEQRSAKDEKQDEECQKDAKVIDVDDLYRIPSSLYPLFVDEITKDYLSEDDLRDALLSYYTKENLLTTNPKMIKLDPQLFHLLAPTTSQKQLSRDVLLRAMMAKCLKYYRLNSQKVKKGSPPTIQIIIEQRSGRKSITRITQLDKYFFNEDLEQICDEMKKRCAVSVSVGPAKIGVGCEVTVQGKKSEDVSDILQHWGIRKSWLTVEDKSK